MLAGCGRKIGPYPCCTVIEGDCLELMRLLPDSCVDAVITDPPYGVGFKYEGLYRDDQEGDYPEFIKSRFLEMRRCSRLVMLTTGMRNIWLYPPANWVLCWAKPGSTRRSDLGGFNEWEPVLVYGKVTIWNDYKYLPDCVNHSKDGGGEHPCPKPIRMAEWLVSESRAETILDPFAGSGTTLVAAKKLGLHSIGMELNPDYVRIAEERIQLVEAQPNLFTPKPEQLTLK